jgi:Zn-dependent protease
MKSQIKLGRVQGIEIGLHYSWFIIALLILLSLQAHFNATNPQWGVVITWFSALVTALLFFASLLAHEMSHSMVAKSSGLPVRSITLFALGGVSQIEEEPATAKNEFLIAVVGPLSSFLIGILFLSVALVFGWDAAAPPVAMLIWLGYINIALAVFNLLPSYPLDGGRILRAAIWQFTGSAARSTRAASRVGQFVAMGMIVFGVIILFTGGGFGGLWIAIIGWFLLDAARTSSAQVEMAEHLRGVRVGDIMARECPAVDGNTNLQTFVEEFLLRTGRHCFVVIENNDIAGIITPHEVKEIDRARRPFKLVSDVMRPLTELHTVSPNTPVMEALETMARDDVSQLPVVRDGHVEGMITRGNVLQFLQTRVQFSA